MTPYEAGMNAAKKVFDAVGRDDIPQVVWAAMDEALRAAIEATRQEMVNEKARDLGAGATGRFPEGSIGPDDEGELKAALMVKDGRLILLFGKPISWLSFTKDEATVWANGLLEKAGRLP